MQPTNQQPVVLDMNFSLSFSSPAVGSVPASGGTHEGGRKLLSPSPTPSCRRHTWLVILIRAQMTKCSIPAGDNSLFSHATTCICLPLWQLTGFPATGGTHVPFHIALFLKFFFCVCIYLFDIWPIHNLSSSLGRYNVIWSWLKMLI